jgi:hypothetical protein
MGDDIEYEAFFLSEDPLLYMVFQFRAPYDGLIWSIQLSGEDAKVDTGFRGLRFGMTEAEVVKILGNPSKRIDVGENGTRWEFEKANYSIEINTDKRLSSIRIVDHESLRSEPDIKKIPSFKSVLKTLTSGTNVEMAELLAPDMEIYIDGDASYFGKRLSKEIASDDSKIFSTIRALSQLLQEVDIEKNEEFEENLRLRIEAEPMHVYKFKKSRRVKEIVLRWDGSRWRLWEFDAGRPMDNADPAASYIPRKLSDLEVEAGDELERRPNMILFGPDKSKILALSYDPFRSAVSGTFSGETRATAPFRVELMEHSLLMFGRPKELAKSYLTEIGMIENGKTYWLAIDKETLESLNRSVKKGDSLVLYITWLGIIYREKDRGFVYLVHGFQAGTLPSSPAVRRSDGSFLSGHEIIKYQQGSHPRSRSL